eukprot:3151457-Rhodomonas_salina.1
MPKYARTHDKLVPLRSVHALQHLAMIRGALQRVRELRAHAMLCPRSERRAHTERWVAAYMRGDELYATAIRLGIVDGNPRAFHNVHEIIVDARKNLGLVGHAVPACAAILENVEFAPPEGGSLVAVFDRQEAQFHNWAMAFNANDA